MATVNIRMKTPTRSGKVIVTYCDPASPNILYEAALCADTSSDIQIAIQAHIDQRKAYRGPGDERLDYPGKPTLSPNTVTIT